jgi:DNA-binding NarL/FixJ family response regulator
LRPPRLPPHASGRAIRVALGADDFLEREGITRVLEHIDGIELVAACAGSDELRREIERTEPDVVLADVARPAEASAGIALAAELRSTHPRIGVVVLSDRAEPGHATALFAEGSYRRAYMLKDRLADAAELGRAIREVADGGAVVDPRIVDEFMAARRRRERAAPLAALTPREREILALIAEGLANSAIAERLSISKRGVERHVNAIFSKLALGDGEDVSRRVKAALVFLAGEPQ